MSFMMSLTSWKGGKPKTASFYCLQWNYLGFGYTAQVCHCLPYSSRENFTFLSNCTGLSLPTIAKYRKLYIPLNGFQLDDLCSWVSEKRKQFIHLGRRMFQGACASAVDTKVDTSSSSLPAGVISSEEKEELSLKWKDHKPVRPFRGKWLKKAGKGPIRIQSNGQKVSWR